MHIKSNNQVINNYLFDIMHKDGTPAQPRQFLFLVARVTSIEKIALSKIDLFIWMFLWSFRKKRH